MKRLGIGRALRVAVTAVIACLPASALAQTGQPGWDPTGVQLTRPELEALLAQYEATAESSAYSSALREQAGEEAALIRARLTEGDLQVGDRIQLTVEGQQELTDTFSVVAGRVLVLPSIGEIPLQGVLRSELTAHLSRAIARYIREPVVRARSLIRLQVTGAVAAQGFYTIPSDILLSDALMLAGGPSADANLSEVRIERGGTVIWSGERLREAVQNGRTLDQLSVRAGDGIIVPERSSGRFDLVRNGIILLSSLTSLIVLFTR